MHGIPRCGLIKGVAAALIVGMLCPAGVAAPRSASAEGESPLQVTALDPWSAMLQWNALPDVARIEIRRDGRLLDDVATSGGTTLSYTDHLLWQSTAYAYEVIAFDASNQIISDETTSVTTPAQTAAFPTLYDPASFWNQPIPATAAIDPDSAAMVSASLASYAGSANFANSNEWGKPLAYANPVSMTYPVGCVRYDCGTSVSFAIPRYAAPSTGSDHHLTVLDPATNNELDMWLATYDAGAASWTAGSRYVTASNGWGAQCSPGQRCQGAVAAGFAAFGGIVRPEEIAQGHIDHALFFTSPYTRAGDIACPATHTDGWVSDPAAIPEGARIQLDPTFDVDGQAWPTWEKIIAHALQTYGAYLGDSGGSVAFSAEPNLDRGYDAWSLAGVAAPDPSLADLPWSSFRVLQLQPC